MRMIDADALVRDHGFFIEDEDGFPTCVVCETDIRHYHTIDVVAQPTCEGGQRMKCVDCPDYKTCRRQNDLRRKRHKCKKANEPFVQTNADRIRAMSDEELAEFMAERYDREHTARILGELIGRGYTPDRTTRMALHEKVRMQWLDWLRQPVKDGDTDGKSNDPE